METAGSEIVDPLHYELHGYPHASWAWLRRHRPVARFEPPGMKPFWAITRYADLEAIARDPKRFQIAPRMAVFPEEQYSTENFPYHHLLNMDPPMHGKYRSVMAPYFTPRALETKRATIGRIVDEALDGVAERGECDFVESIAALVPLWVICDMLSVPREQWERMFHLSNALVGGVDPEFQEPGESATQAVERSVREIFALFRRMAEERRRAPQDDLPSILANARVDGGLMADWELVSYFALLIVAGNETTRNATSGGMLALLENPGELARLRADRSLLKSAVEEILRWVSPVIQFCRTPVEDVEIGGTVVPRGEACCLFYPSANRDEEVFAEPFEFRIDRDPNEHFAFGIGVHYCLGANLARLELQEIFSRVIERLADVELAGPVERMRSSFVGGIKRMPIRFRAVG